MKTKQQALQAVRSSYRYTLFTREGERWVKYERGCGGTLDRQIIRRLPEEVFAEFSANRGTRLGRAVLWDGWRSESVIDTGHSTTTAPSGEVVLGAAIGALVGALLKD